MVNSFSCRMKLLSVCYMNEKAFSPKESCLLKGGTPSVVEGKGEVRSSLWAESSTFLSKIFVIELSVESFLYGVQLCTQFSSLDEVILPCILNLMCFILNDSRMHNLSLWKYVFRRKPFIATYLLFWKL